jgi:CheY-like chemotaxis protein
MPKPKVLLADDNFDMREYVARLLAPKYEVISVANGSCALSLPLSHTFCALGSLSFFLSKAVSCACIGLEALSVLRAHSQAVDLVLTDIMMPFLDGFGLLKEIRCRT